MTRSIRVMIDARMLLGRPSGVGRFVTRLVDELVQLPGIEITALCGDESPGCWNGRSDIAVITTDFHRSQRTAFRRRRWEERRLPGILNDARVDLFHATWNTGVPREGRVPCAVTVHDLIPLHDPNTYFNRAWDRWAYGHSLRASTRRAHKVTTVSDYVRDQIISQLGVASSRVVTIHNGADFRSTARERSGHDERPFVLCVGGYEPRKNLSGVLAGMECYWRTFDPTLELRLIGVPRRMDRGAETLLDRLVDQRPIRFVGDVDDEQLAGLYTHAAAVLVLSRDEGFGLPTVEAMALGCPVVAARSAALPEVVGDAGRLVSPDDPGEIADALHAVIHTEEVRAEYIRRGFKRAGQFSWRSAAARFAAVYESIASCNPSRTHRAVDHHVAPRPVEAVNA